MRTIKFRAWDKNNERFLDWFQLSKMEDVKFDMGMFESANWLVFQQFTGLLDKNGKEIYEGDLLKTAGLVKFGKNYAEGGNERIGFFSDYNSFKYSMEKDEVIGNIYENPELLKPNLP